MRTSIMLTVALSAAVALAAFGVQSALAAADLSLSRSADVSAAPGGALVFSTITVRNEGDETARNVVVTDTLDTRFVFNDQAGTERIAARLILANGADHLSWNLGDLAAGGDVQLRYSVVTPFLTSDAAIDNVALADAVNAAEVSASADITVDATAVSAPRTEIGVPAIGGPVDGALPSTGVSPLVIGALLLPLALGIRQWALARHNS